MSVQKDLSYYIDRLTNLNVNTVGGKAPYQPLLLLSVIDLIKRKLIQENRIYLSLELISTFVKFRSQLSTPNYQADLAQPFFFLSRAENPFWYGCDLNLMVLGSNRKAILVELIPELIPSS